MHRRSRQPEERKTSCADLGGGGGQIAVDGGAIDNQVHSSASRL